MQWLRLLLAFTTLAIAACTTTQQVVRSDVTTQATQSEPELALLDHALDRWYARADNSDAVCVASNRQGMNAFLDRLRARYPALAQCSASGDITPHVVGDPNARFGLVQIFSWRCLAKERCAALLSYPDEMRAYYSMHWDGAWEISEPISDWCIHGRDERGQACSEDM